MHALDQFCAEHHIVHYLIDPGKPAQNGTVERSHREDQEKFYEQNKFRSIRDLRKKAQSMEYLLQQSRALRIRRQDAE